jgi:OTU domain-containing protein 6
MEELETRHRKEQRDLQALVIQKKKGASKKTRKSVNTECEELEQRMKERHRLERAQLEQGNELEVDKTQSTSSEERAVTNDHESAAKVQTEEGPNPNTLQDSSLGIGQQEDGSVRKPNRQKARLARRAAEQEAQTAQAAEEASNLPDLRDQERQAMSEALEQYHLQEKSIRPDGHCLYSAVADQLTILKLDLMPSGSSTSLEDQELPQYKIIRRAAADYVEGHPDDFEPYLEEALPLYVHKIRDTAQWGGQLELAALAKTYGVEINVLQGSGQIVKLEPEGPHDPQKIWLAYYRHTFGLGEHYNSLRKIS